VAPVKPHDTTHPLTGSQFWTSQPDGGHATRQSGLPPQSTSHEADSAHST